MIGVSIGGLCVAEPVMRYYPSCRYAAGGKTCRVDTPEEDVQLGAGWYKSPADVPRPVTAAPPAVKKSHRKKASPPVAL